MILEALEYSAADFVGDNLHRAVLLHSVANGRPDFFTGFVWVPGVGDFKGLGSAVIQLQAVVLLNVGGGCFHGGFLRFFCCAHIRSEQA